MMQHFIHAFKLYGVFSGRSTREEYWTFTLIYILVYTVLSSIAFALDNTAFQIVFGLLSISVIIPNISITTRRLHDAGRSGWWQLAPVIGFIFTGIGLAQQSSILAITGAVLGVILFIILYFFLVVPSQEDNQYGAKPTSTPESKKS